MKNLKNDFCIHPKGGWPKEGVYLVYYKGCGGDRLRFNFFDLGEKIYHIKAIFCALKYNYCDINLGV